MMSLREVAEFTHGRIVGSVPEIASLQVGEVTIDSRALEPGALFVALAGERFDGHDFLDQVAARGAAAALVGEGRGAASLPLVAVRDTRVALGDLAAGWRGRFSMPVVMIAGSNGKTTTKEMIAAIFTAAFGADDQCATRGNLNNEIGVPLTLLRLRTHHRAAVIEIGMNHPGETAQLAAMVRPDIALIVNAQREHQEFMTSVDAVAAEHAFAIAALADDGIAVFPADDPHADGWRRAAGARRVIDFACVTARDGEPPATRAAVFARAYVEAMATIVHLETPSGAITVHLAAPGLHNARNATAAAAAAIAAGIGLDAIGRGLEAFLPVRGRSQPFVTALGSTVVDDSYNANPDSVRAAIDWLATHEGPRLLVFGDMGEVGAAGADFHAEIGRHARDAGIDALHAIGDASRETVSAFGGAGVHFVDMEPLIVATSAWVAAHEQTSSPRAALLVKGSRFMRMERVVAALRGGPPSEGTH